MRRYTSILKYLHQTSFKTYPKLKEINPKIELHFASLIPLADAKNLFESPKTVNSALTFKSPVNLKNTRISLKKSVLLAAWLHYLATNLNVASRASITALPKKRKLYTLTKAPMAHKTNSKEQYMFKFFFFRCSFQLPFRNLNAAKSVHQSILSSNFVQCEFPWISTNLLIIKSLAYTHSSIQSNYVNYFNFVKRIRLQ